MKVLFHKQLITQYKPTGILSKHGHRCIHCSRVVPCGQTDWQRLTWAKMYAILDICKNYLIRHTYELTSCSDFIDRNVIVTGTCSSSTPVPSSTLILTSSISSSEDVRYLSVNQVQLSLNPCWSVRESNNYQPWLCFLLLH
jgi:hypothetical protein